MRIENKSPFNSEDFDLMVLFEGLWRQKLLIASVAFLITGAAAAYAFLAKPTYEARVVVQPPTQNDISQLNYGRGGDSGLSNYSVKEVYSTYLRILNSESLRREFFRKYYLPSLPDRERKGTQDALYADFNEAISVAQVSAASPDRYYVVARRTDGAQAANWIGQYVQRASELAKVEVARDARSDARVKATNLEQQINAARESAIKQRKDQIEKLSEALKVAAAVGLEKPPIIANTLTGEVSAGMGGSLTYMRGSKALQAEIQNLRTRLSDDPFVDNLRQRQETLAFYRSLEIDPAVIEVYRQDGAIESPDEPVKPKKGLILILGTFVGLAAGIVVALLRNLQIRMAREGRIGERREDF